MEYRNILIIKMSSLGDVLRALPFVAAFRDRFPPGPYQLARPPAVCRLCAGSAHGG